MPGSLESNNLIANPPAGYQLADVKVDTIPSGGPEDAGIVVQLDPGEGALIVHMIPIDVGSDPVKISVWARSSSSNVALALAALNSPIDGQLGFTNPSGSDVPVVAYVPLRLLYSPPDGSLLVAVQAVATEAAEVAFTKITVERFHSPQMTPVQLLGDGGFESTENIMTNIGHTDTGTGGEVLRYTDGTGNHVVGMKLVPENTAANIGTFTDGLQEGFPVNLVAEVDAGLYEGETGVTALVMTNGVGNVGAFVNNAWLAAHPGQSPLWIGGEFLVPNASFPVLTVVQNGGPGADSLLLIDNLKVSRLPYEQPDQPIEQGLPDLIPT